MRTSDQFDVIIIGGSYAGLAAGLALGRALRKVLIIDSGAPCNRQTPHSHNFLTNDGKTPGEISRLAREQVSKYDSVSFLNGVANSGIKTAAGFQVGIESGETFYAKKLIFATGIKDSMPDIPGFAACWGISVIHCPYCHGYEVHHQKTGILENGDGGYEFAGLISNWTKDLTLYTNGRSTLTEKQTATLEKHHIPIVEEELARLEHQDGQLQHLVFTDGKQVPITALYARRPFVQHCSIPQSLGCELTAERYIKIDNAQKTTIPGVYACGDNTSRMRTVANAVAMGTTAGMMVNKELVEEDF